YRCADLAYEARSWILGPAAQKELREVGFALSVAREPPNLDTLFREGRFPFHAASPHVDKPWAPAVLFPSLENGNVETKCGALSLLATLDHWDDGVVLLTGEPGCTITNDLRSIRLRDPRDAMVNTDHFRGDGAAEVL